MDFGIYFGIFVILIIIISLFIVAKSIENRKKLENQKKQEAKKILKKAFSNDSFWDKEKIENLVKKYQGVIEECREQLNYLQLDNICTQEVKEEIIKKDKDRLKYYKFFLNKVSIISVNDKINDEKDEIKILLEGNKDRLSINTEEVIYIPFYEQLWTLKRKENSWIIVDVDYDIEDEELEELKSNVE